MTCKSQTIVKADDGLVVEPTKAGKGAATRSTVTVYPRSMTTDDVRPSWASPSDRATGSPSIKQRQAGAAVTGDGLGGRWPAIPGCFKEHILP